MLVSSCKLVQMVSKEVFSSFELILIDMFACLESLFLWHVMLCLQNLDDNNSSLFNVETTEGLT